MPNQNTIIVGAGSDDGFDGSCYIFTGYGSNWTQTQKVTYSGASADLFGSLHGSLAATEKEIFLGSDDGEKVIRYRI